MHSLKENPEAHNEFGDLVSISHPNGTGVLRLQPYNPPGSVNKENLRNLTNVDSATPLTWQNWGSYSGYQHDYSENGSFFRQWWLVKDNKIIFIVYSSTAELTDTEVDEVNKIVDSLEVTSS